MSAPHDYPKIRLYVEPDLAAGASLELPQKQAHYVTQVMRKSAGEPIALFNGRDGEWRATIAHVGKKTCTLQVESRLREQKSTPDIWLLFAPLKHGPIDYLAEKATELGVSALRPVITRHTITTRVNVERLRANAIEAAEQCERLDVPDVTEPTSFDEMMRSWPANRTLIYCDETGKGETLKNLLPTLTSTAWAVFTGPEGGFAMHELSTLAKLPQAVGASLGPRVMRADTAAIAALACLQAWCGDWEEKPAFRAANTKEQAHG